jgi:hypothetical protein
MWWLLPTLPLIYRHLSLLAHGVIMQFQQAPRPQEAAGIPWVSRGPTKPSRF